jgi:hypothetical protein
MLVLRIVWSNSVSFRGLQSKYSLPKYIYVAMTIWKGIWFQRTGSITQNGDNYYKHTLIMECNLKTYFMSRYS